MPQSLPPELISRLSGIPYEFQKRLKVWGFTCSCHLCFEAKDLDKKIKAKRKGLRADLNLAFENGNTDDGIDSTELDFGKLERLLGQLEETTTKGISQKTPRTELWEPCLVLAKSYAGLRRFDKVLRATIKTLERLGFEIADGNSSIAVKKWGLVVEDVVDCWLLVWTVYVLLKDAKKADEAKHLAITSLQDCCRRG